MRKENEIPQQGLYRESFEHDNCGIGAIVNIKGQKKPQYSSRCTAYRGKSGA